VAKRSKSTHRKTDKARKSKARVMRRQSSEVAFSDEDPLLIGEDVENDSRPVVELLMRAFSEKKRAGRHGAERRFEAQELAFDAMDTAAEGNFDGALELACRAISIYPDCVDALHLITDLITEHEDDRADFMERVVEAAERDLGEDFDDFRGEFWGFIETRPYMRARAALADSLTRLGEHESAIRHCEGMLELNPNDNQGIRYGLLGLYLFCGRLDDTRRLIDRYENDLGMAFFAYGNVLLHLLEDDESAAAEALKAARKANPHAEVFLSGAKRCRKRSPAYYSPGEESEAIVCMQTIGDAWKKHRAARQWLRAQS